MSKDNQIDKILINLIEKIKELGITSSPSTTLDVALDIKEESANSRALGQMVSIISYEDDKPILSIGQIVEVTTKNRWHEDQSFKGVIKRYGALPNLSGIADNRVANISVQSSFDLSGTIPDMHILGMSPSTGIKVKKMNNDVICALVRHQKESVTRIGQVYGTKVDLPMWFKHFGKDEGNANIGAGDAYHIGVFGKTGSGKTVTSAMMLLGYAKNKDKMSILVLDPQKQFTTDRELLPNGQSLDNSQSLEKEIRKAGMKYTKINLIKEVSLPKDDLSLFGDLLISNGFIQDAFGPFYQQEKIEAMRDSIILYFEGRMSNTSFNLSNINPIDDLQKMLDRFLDLKNGEKDYTKYIKNVYAPKQIQERLRGQIKRFCDKVNLSKQESNHSRSIKKWLQVCSLFSEGRQTMGEITQKIVAETGNFVVLDLSSDSAGIDNENLHALFLQLVEKSIVESGGEMYAQGKKANCLIVMDEAHRFVARNSPDPRVRELTKEIVDSVRTTRKYGIGHMFITQSLESMDDEIIKQMRIYAFGHGLTIGSELRKVREIINNKSAVSLYQSFIDPSNNKRYPFMFFGPVSPFSATGSPLFIETYTEYQDYVKANN